MPIYGVCKACGNETIDYACGPCMSREIDQLTAERDAAVKALEGIAGHDIETCDGITSRDCLDSIRETAREVLAQLKGPTDG